MNSRSEKVQAMADEMLAMSDTELANYLAETPGAMIDLARMMKLTFQEISDLPDNEKENYFDWARAYVASERNGKKFLN